MLKLTNKISEYNKYGSHTPITKHTDTTTHKHMNIIYKQPAPISNKYSNKTSQKSATFLSNDNANYNPKLFINSYSLCLDNN